VKIPQSRIGKEFFSRCDMWPASRSTFRAASRLTLLTFLMPFSFLIPRTERSLNAANCRQAAIPVSLAHSLALSPSLSLSLSLSLSHALPFSLFLLSTISPACSLAYRWVCKGANKKIRIRTSSLKESKNKVAIDAVRDGGGRAGSG